jgi:hypothetical protein
MISINREIERVVEDTVKRVNNELKTEYQFKVYSVYAEVEGYDLDVEINIGYVVHLMEISEAVSEGFSEYVAELEDELGRELSDDEVEELWRDAYEDTLEELNAEYAYYVSGEIEYYLGDKYPFYSGVMRVRVEPLLCDGDYCDVGAWVNIKFEKIRIETVEKASDKFSEFLASVLHLVREFLTL